MRKLIRPFLPKPETLTKNRFLAPFSNTLLHPELWHIHRRNVAKAVAVGLFSGLIPGPLQIITAVILATTWRANMPLAILCTFYTNPLTIVPLYFGAFYIGQFLLGSHEQFAPPPPISFDQWSITLQHWGNWLFGLGNPLGLGLVVLACSLAISGYFITDFLWRFYVQRRWQKRQQRPTKP